MVAEIASKITVIMKQASGCSWIRFGVTLAPLYFSGVYVEKDPGYNMVLLESLLKDI